MNMNLKVCAAITLAVLCSNTVQGYVQPNKLPTYRRSSGVDFARRTHKGASPAPKRQLVQRASPELQDFVGQYDDEQIQMMEERVITVDRHDKVVGEASKAETHLVSHGLKLHRAFSVFLFDTQGRLLLQQRSRDKITFPWYWTNTCCSHPLSVPSELGTDVLEAGTHNQDQAATLGCQRAAIRKLEQELGISPSELSVDDFIYLTKIHYIANSDPDWGEHEVDYVFFAQKDVNLNLNLNEVEDVVKYVTADELRDMMDQADRGEIKLTPWSRYIIDEFIFKWWPLVGDRKALEAQADDFSVIHRVGPCAEEPLTEEEEAAALQPLLQPVL